MFLHLMERIPLIRLMKFAITGGSALVIDVAIYFVLTRFLSIPYLVSRTVSLTVAIFWNFTLNRYWTFQAVDGNVGRQFSRFLIVIVSTSALNLALMRIGVSYLHLYDLLVIGIISVLIMMINFFAHSLWSYADRGTSPAIVTDPNPFEKENPPRA
jgi:putative flippase GtrA